MQTSTPEIPETNPVTRRLMDTLTWSGRLRARLSAWIFPLSTALLDELDELRAMKEGIAKLKELHATERGFEMAIQTNPELATYIGHCFAEIVASSENYTEMKFEPKAVEHRGKWEHITVTVQKESGKTPHQLRMAAQAEAAKWCEWSVNLQKQLDAMTAERDRIRDGKWSQIIEQAKTLESVFDHLDGYARTHPDLPSAAQAALADVFHWRTEAFRLRDKNDQDLAKLTEAVTLGKQQADAIDALAHELTGNEGEDDPITVIRDAFKTLRENLFATQKANGELALLIELGKIPPRYTSYDLGKQVEAAADQLPEGWRIQVEVERGSGSVLVTRPDGTEVNMSDGELDIPEQFRDAVRLALDETAAAEMDQQAASDEKPATPV